MAAKKKVKTKEVIPKAKPPLLKSRRILIWVGIVVLVGALFFLGYKYMQTKNELTKLEDPQATAQQEADKLVAEVGKYIELPNETPTLATVSDVTKLQGQQFFAKAQNGDQVLIYSQSKKALLYRPSTKKVIEYASVSMGEDPSQQNQTQE